MAGGDGSKRRPCERFHKIGATESGQVRDAPQGDSRGARGVSAFLVDGVQVTVAEKQVALTIRGRIFAVPGAAAALTGVAGAPAVPAAQP